jgi:hypothetical protein
MTTNQLKIHIERLIKDCRHYEQNTVTDVDYFKGVRHAYQEVLTLLSELEVEGYDWQEEPVCPKCKSPLDLCNDSYGEYVNVVGYCDNCHKTLSLEQHYRVIS